MDYNLVTVKDIDWTLNLVLSSNKVGILDQPLINMVVVGEEGTIQFEMSPEEMENVVEKIEAALNSIVKSSSEGKCNQV